jgi:signal transduction histidine kinase/DNA-binding response OmpR family regulator
MTDDKRVKPGEAGSTSGSETTASRRLPPVPEPQEIFAGENAATILSSLFPTGQAGPVPGSAIAGPPPDDAPDVPGCPILVVDDDPVLRVQLLDHLGGRGFSVRTAASGAEGLALPRVEKTSVALIDINMPGMDGLGMLAGLKRLAPDAEVILMTGHASVETAVEAIRHGAYDYLEKPFTDLDAVARTVERACEHRRLAMRNRELVGDLAARNQELSAAIMRLTALIEAGRAMSGIESIDELLDFFIGLVSKELDVERASLMLIDESGRELVVAASRGISDDLAGKIRVRVGDGIAGWVAKEGKPILVKDVQTDPRTSSSLCKDAPAEKPKAEGSFISAPIVLSIPIIVHEKTLGVINVTNKRSGASFTEEDMAFLYGLAGQAAVAIEKARHYNEVKQAYDSLKEAQEQLVSSERLKALGQMAAGVAHDFNNLLNGILGKAELLVLKLSGPETDRAALLSGLKMIEQITLQGAETVKRVQDFTRIRKDHPTQAIDVNAVIRNAVDMTRPKWKHETEARGVAVEVDQLLGDIPPTIGNASELTQVVSNLLFNAVEAMPRGGRITLASKLEGDMIVLTVADTGSGMSKDTQARIFEPFFTTKDAGQGLGMSIVYGILARHGGEIAVDSGEGRGTTFTVRIPVREPAHHVPPKAVDGGVSRPAAATARILIVDDDDLNIRMLDDALTARGHHVVSALTGLEAIEHFSRDAFDLVLTDLSMPGMSGWQVARDIKKRNPAVPVILLSGWAIQQDEEQVRESGVDYVISKPCSIKTLQGAVDEALQNGPRRR